MNTEDEIAEIFEKEMSSDITKVLDRIPEDAKKAMLEALSTRVEFVYGILEGLKRGDNGTVVQNTVFMLTSLGYDCLLGYLKDGTKKI